MTKVYYDETVTQDALQGKKIAVIELDVQLLKEVPYQHYLVFNKMLQAKQETLL